MLAEYRLLKQQQGRGHFAKVEVFAEPSEDGIKVIEEIVEPISEENCEVNRKIAPEWVDAALKGANYCASKLVASGKLAGCTVKLRRIIGTIVDTDDEALICAAALATWIAFHPGKEIPEIEFIDSKWQIKF